eukprot:SAG11_NODE_2874_length_2880_cov_2.944624_2_plen_111_part_00
MCDLLNRDREPLCALVAGADAIVHFGFKQPVVDSATATLNSAGGTDLSQPSDADPTDMFDAEHDNVRTAPTALSCSPGPATVRQIRSSRLPCTGSMLAGAYGVQHLPDGT